MSAVLAWESFLGVGQQPPALMTNAGIVAFDRQNYILVGGLTGRRSKRVFNLRNHGSERGGWRWKDITPEKGDAFEEVCNMALCSLRYDHTAPSCRGNFGGSLGMKVKRKVNLSHGRCMLFLFGGQTQGGDSGRPGLSSATYFLDLENPVGPIWRKLFCPEAPTAREGACALIHHGEIFLFGGRAAALSKNSNGIMNDLWSLDIDNCDMNAQVQNAQAYGGGLGGSTWVPHPKPEFGRYPKGRFGHAMVSIAEKIYMFGGMSDQKLGDLWSWNRKQKWNIVQTVGKVPAARSNHGMLYVAPDSLVVWGGLLKDAPGGCPVMGTTVYVLDLQCLYWTTPYVSGDCPPPRKCMAVSDFTGGIFVCYGGAPCGDVFRNSIDAPQRAVCYTLRCLDESEQETATVDTASGGLTGGANAPPSGADESAAGGISAKASEHFLNEGKERLLQLKLQLQRRKKETVELSIQYHREQVARDEKDRILDALSSDLKRLSGEEEYLKKRNRILHKIGQAEFALRKNADEFCKRLKGLASTVEALMIAKEGGEEYIREIGGETFLKQLQIAARGGGSGANAEAEEGNAVAEATATEVQQQVEPDGAVSFAMTTGAGAGGEKKRKNSAASSAAEAEAAEEAAAEAAEAELEELEREHRELLKQVANQQKKCATDERKFGDALAQLRIELGLLDDTQMLQTGGGGGVGEEAEEDAEHTGDGNRINSQMMSPGSSRRKGRASPFERSPHEQLSVDFHQTSQILLDEAG